MNRVESRSTSVLPSSVVRSRARSLGVAATALAMLGIVPAAADASRAQGGANPADAASANERKGAVLRAAGERIRDSFDMYYGARWVPHLRAELAKAGEDAPFEARYELERSLADGLLREGKVQESIDTLSRLGQSMSESGRGGQLETVELLRALAAA